MRVRSLLSNVSVEPTLFLTVVAATFIILGVQNLNEQKTCSPDVRPPIDFVCNDSVRLSEAAEILLTKNTIRSILSAVTVPFLGSWRDVTGNNKLLIFGALTANAVSGGVYLLSAWIWSMSPWIPAIVDGVLGGILSDGINVAAACVIAETSAPEDRTIRYQFMVISTLLGSGIASLINGSLLVYLGYIWFLLTAIGFYIAGLIMALILVKRKSSDEKKKKYEILKKFKLVFKSRHNGAVAWIMLMIPGFVTNMVEAESIVAIYYYQKMFGFTMTQVGLYGAYRLMYSVLGGMLMSPLFAKVFKWSDFRIGVVSSILSIISSVCMVEAKTMLELYLYAVLDALKFVLFSPPKAIISKCVENDELGTFTGFGSVVTIILPLITNYFYKAIFSATSETLPSAFFFVSAVGFSVVLLSFSVCYCIYKQPKEGSIENNNKLEETH